MTEVASHSEHIMAILAAAGSSGTWDWDIAADVLRVDERFAELCGLDPTEGLSGLPAKAFFKAIHPDDRARMKIAVAGMLGGAETFSKEFRIVTPDGGTVWVHGRGQCHLDEHDQPKRFTGLLVDVTDRKRTEEKLRVAQTAGGVGSFEYMDGFATVSVSETFCRLLGLHPTSVLPVQTINAVSRGDGRSLIPSAGEVSAPGATLDAEFQFTRVDDGTRRWIARRGEIIRDGEGYRLVGVIYDITGAKDLEGRLRELNDTLEMRVEAEVAERHQAEETLRQAQKMEAVGHLTGGIAHDFNNLLMIIIGNIDTVNRRLDTSADPRAKRSLASAMKGAERAAALTQRLLAFSRQQPLDPKSIDVARLLSGMSDLLTRTITETITVDIVASPETWRIEADPNQLENAVLNLVVNARDAMANGGRLSIVAENVTREAGEKADLASGDYVAIRVVDTGSGMSPETIAKVFDPFFTTKEIGKGTGLGLSMVYGFAKQSGGAVDISSTLDVGTTVSIILPRVSTEAVEPALVEEDQAPAGRKDETLLVVEDDDDVRAYTVGILRELGYRVIESHDGPAALRLLERQDTSVNLLITDVIMPHMSGSELAERARDIQADLRVLYNSGYTRDAILKDGKLPAGVDLLQKPFTYASLAAKVRELLDRPVTM
jgi:PAS domain S-box-containing protein